MVNNVTSLTRNGLRDWLVQRVSAIVLALYTIFLAVYFLVYSPVVYHAWVALFANRFVQVFSLLALLSLLLHAWIGLWTVLTDYVKCSHTRLSLEIVIVLALLGYFVWGVLIVWSV